MAQSVASASKKKQKKSGGNKIFGAMFRKKKKSTSPASVITEEEMALEWDSPSLNRKKLREEARQLVAKESPQRQKPTLSKASWFCRTKYFEKMCDQAFAAIDADKSESVDAKELYSGLLLIHLKLGTYAGPAACRPLSRERAETVFHKFDVDGSGTLDKEEFRNVMTVLFGNVFFRVLVQWTLTLMVVPMVAQAFVDLIALAWGFLVTLVQNLDERSELANTIELSVEGAVGWCGHSLAGLVPYSSKIGEYLQMVPASVWEAIPVGLVSTVLGIIVVPWCIFQVDDFFQRMADQKSKVE